MNKKLICLALAMVMLCAASTAFAASSIGGGDLTYTAPAKKKAPTTSFGDYDVPLASGAVISVLPSAEGVDDILAAVLAADSVGGFFGLAGELELAELIALTVSGYDPAVGAITQLFSFPTVLSGKVIAMVCVGSTWTQVAVEVVGGSAKITFPQELLEAMEGKVAHLAILIEK